MNFFIFLLQKFFNTLYKSASDLQQANKNNSPNLRKLIVRDERFGSNRRIIDPERSFSSSSRYGRVSQTSSKLPDSPSSLVMCLYFVCFCPVPQVSSLISNVEALEQNDAFTNDGILWMLRRIREHLNKTYNNSRNAD